MLFVIGVKFDIYKVYRKHVMYLVKNIGNIINLVYISFRSMGVQKLGSINENCNYGSH